MTKKTGEEGTVQQSQHAKDAFGTKNMWRCIAESAKEHRGRSAVIILGGMVGIACMAIILMLMNGVGNMVGKSAENTLRMTPIEISGTALDLSAFSSTFEDIAVDLDVSLEEGASEDEGKPEDDLGKFRVKSTVAESLIATGNVAANASSFIHINDLSALRAYIEDGKGGIKNAADYIDYDYGVSPSFYTDSADGQDVYRVYPDNSQSSLMMSLANMLGGAFGFGVQTGNFFKMPSSENLYKDSYKVLAGHWPEAPTEFVLVVDADSTELNDYLLYQIGLLDHRELDALIDDFSNGKKIEAPEHSEVFTYDDLMKCTLKIVEPAAVYGRERGRWTDKSADDAFMRLALAKSETAHIVGVVAYSGNGPKALSAGVNYPASLQQHIIERSADYEIVKQQLANPKINVLKGKPFTGPGSELTFEELGLDNAFIFDEDALYRALKGVYDMLEIPDIELNVTELFDPSKMEIDIERLGIAAADLVKSIENLNLDFSDMPALPESLSSSEDEQKTQTVLEKLIEAWLVEGIEQDGTGKVVDVAVPTEEELEAYFESEQFEQDLMKLLEDVLGAESEKEIAELETWLEDELIPYLEGKATYIIDTLTEDIGLKLAAAIETLLDSELAKTISRVYSEISSDSGIDFDKVLELVGKVVKITPNPSTTTEAEVEDAFGSVLGFDLARADLGLLVAVLCDSSNTAQDVLSKCGYADLTRPNAICIYADDAMSRSAIKAALDEYSTSMVDAGKPAEKICYMDLLGETLSPLAGIIGRLGIILALPCVLVMLVFAALVGATASYDGELERTCSEEHAGVNKIPESLQARVRIFKGVFWGLCSGVLGILLAAILGLVATLILQAVGVNLTLVPALGSSLALICCSVVIAVLASIPSARAVRKEAAAKHAEA